MKTLLFKEWQDRRWLLLIVIGLAILIHATLKLLSGVMDYEFYSRLAYFVYPLGLAIYLGIVSFSREFLDDSRAVFNDSPRDAGKLFWIRYFSGLIILLVSVLISYFHAQLFFRFQLYGGISQTEMIILIFFASILYTINCLSIILIRKNLPAIICAPFLLLLGILILLPFMLVVSFLLTILFVPIIVYGGFLFFCFIAWKRAVYKAVSAETKVTLEKDDTRAKEQRKPKGISLSQLLIAPKKAFQNDGDCPNFKIPALIILVSILPLFFMAYSKGYSMALSHGSLPQDLLPYNLLQKAIASILAMLMNIMIYLMYLLEWFIRYKLLNFGARKLGGASNPRLLKSRVGYCYLPLAIRGILLVLSFLILGKTPPNLNFFSLTFFMPDIEVNSRAFILLSQLGIFNIWSFILLVFAITSTCNIPRIKAVYLMLALFVLEAAFSISIPPDISWLSIPDSDVVSGITSISTVNIGD